MNELPCTDELRSSPALAPETPAIAWDRRAASPASIRGTTKVEQNAAPRILVVEDDVFFRQLNTAILEHAGYAVDSVEDGAAAWNALNAGHYDLMVTDNSMPKVSGVELLRKLHAAKLTLPVIMASGAIPTTDLNLQPALQPTAILVKPYAIAELVHAVSKVLSERKALAADTPDTGLENQTRTE